MELERVHTVHPETLCLQAPRDAWRLPSVLADCALLDRLVLTAEDMGKAEMYLQERKRRDVQRSVRSLDDYLRGLNLRMTLELFDPSVHMERTVQLLQKTNQFNLTTRRHDQGQILRMVEDGAIIVVGSLVDQFGNYGRVILAIIVSRDDGTAELDSFLMSCRAIGRRVEHAFMQKVLEILRGRGIRNLAAQFARTQKNSVCSEFLSELGFETLREKSSEDTIVFERDTGDAAVGKAALELITVHGP